MVNTLSYRQILDYLFSLTNKGMRQDLTAMHQICNALGHPELTYKTIHVAGTNGKGSVSTKIAAALTHAGYKTGLYTSPHINTFRERIRVDGQLISERDVAACFNRIQSVVEHDHIPVTFFEFTTALAFLYFSQQHVDWVVFETGLGGRLDATNVIKPELAVITSIALEHTDILGSTLEQIAKEKAGIIKSDIPVVIGPYVPINVMPVQTVQVNTPSTWYDEENSQIAEEALKILKLDPHSIHYGIKQRPMCRFEHVRPNVILDVAHNPDGIKQLFKALDKFYPNQPMHLIFGISSNKDVLGCLTSLPERVKKIYLVSASNGRGLPVEELYQKALEANIDPQKLVKASVEDALKTDDLIVVCGTFFIMNDVRQALGICDPQDPFDLNEKAIQHKAKQGGVPLPVNNNELKL